MWGSVIAVLGTLLGSVTAYLLQQRTARREHADVRRHEERRDRITAVTALVAALADHRRAMWVREAYGFPAPLTPTTRPPVRPVTTPAPP